MKKFISCIVVIIICLTSFALVGCSNGTVEIDKTKTQLYVEYFDGGIGGEWLQKAAKRFEEEYANEVFEPGTDKVGVQIVLNPSTSADFSTLSKSSYNVFFTESVNYFRYASEGLFLDLSDVVKATLPNESVTLESKLSDAHKTALTAIDGKYYAIPHYEFFHSAMYDKDLFDANLLYYSANGGLISSLSDKKSAGPDGIEGTGDDGMPVTYDEFFYLCDVMVSKGITPFVWTNEFSGYLLKFISALAANYGGYEDWFANYSFTGNAKIFDTDTMTESEISVTPSTGYVLSQQAGKYYALDFFKKILSNSDYYTSNSLLTTFSNIDAQTDFIYSSLENKPIAMIIEGSFWENEARKNNIFENSVNSFGSRAENRNFGIMSLPLGNDGQAKKTTLLDNALSYAFVNANIKSNENLVKLSKRFVQYCYTDESLKEFTITTNMTKAVNYSLTDADYNSLSAYGKQLWDLRKASDVVYQISDSKIFMNNPTMFDFSNRFTSVVGGNTYLLPITAYRANVSSKDFFNGMKKTEQSWNTDYGAFFD